MFCTLLKDCTMKKHVSRNMKYVHKIVNLKNAAVIVHSYLVLTRKKVSKG